MRAIAWSLDVTKLVQVQYGESNFTRVDEFWIDFKPDGGQKSTMFAANIIPDTPGNRAALEEIVNDYKARKQMNDDFDSRLYRHMNRFERK